VLDGDVIFVPGEIPRHGGFAFWGAGPGTDKVELVFPGGTYGVRKLAGTVSEGFRYHRKLSPAKSRSIVGVSEVSASAR
jgi:hypothetical protein